MHVASRFAAIITTALVWAYACLSVSSGTMAPRDFAPAFLDATVSCSTDRPD